MELKRVVVTGFGAITPIGNNAQEYWENLVKGVSGAAPITLFDSTNFKTKFACEVKNFNPLDHFEKKEAKKWTETLNSVWWQLVKLYHILELSKIK